MKNFSIEFAQAKTLIEQAKHIVIISHRGPDGDAVGANLGLKLALISHFGKNPEHVVSACVDPTPTSSHFLKGVKDYVRDFNLGDEKADTQNEAGAKNTVPDLLISVDCGASNMVKFGETKPTLFSGKIPFINIDHHSTNDNFGTLNIVDPQAAAACVIVYNFLIFCGVTLDRHMSTALLHGLYFDTGSFMHSNTTPEVLQIASKLMWRGADYKTIVRNQFHTMPVRQLKLFGRAFERTKVNSKGVTVSTLTAQDFNETGALNEDTNGAIDYLNSVPEGKLACLLYEDRKGLLKGSLRTMTDDVNVSKLAGMFGGGGHKRASGFAVPGKFEMSEEGVKISGDSK